MNKNIVKRESQLITDLKWRYATKKFDATKKIPDNDVYELLEVLRLSASSFGLQPWKFVVVTDKKLREELKKHAWNQLQITDASHLIILCSQKEVDENYVKKYLDYTAKERAVAAESFLSYQQMAMGFINAFSPEEQKQWKQKQVYLALGNLLTACAIKHIDSCPMEGFDSKMCDKILSLDKLGLESAVLCAVGYRADDDKNATLKKVRFKQEDVVVFR